MQGKTNTDLSQNSLDSKKKPNSTKMMSRRFFLIVASAFALATNASEYNDYPDNYQQDYSQDGLYADYARQQQAKEVSAEA